MRLQQDIGMRTRYKLGALEPFTFIADGKPYSWRNCVELGRLSLLDAGVVTSVLKTAEAKFILIVVVNDREVIDPHGFSEGFYSATVIDEELATKLSEGFSTITS